MADFHTSTHRAQWIFTPQELAILTKYRPGPEECQNAIKQNPNNDPNFSFSPSIVKDLQFFSKTRSFRVAMDDFQTSQNHRAKWTFSCHELLVRWKKIMCC